MVIFGLNCVCYALIDFQSRSDHLFWAPGEQQPGNFTTPLLCLDDNFGIAPLQLTLSWVRKIRLFLVWISLTLLSTDFHAFYLLDERKLLSEILSPCRHTQTMKASPLKLFSTNYTAEFLQLLNSKVVQILDFIRGDRKPHWCDSFQ